MRLTDIELAMLDSIIYDAGLFNKGPSIVGRDLGSILNEYVNGPICPDISSAQLSVIRHVLDDARLSHLVLLDVDSYRQRGSCAICLQDPTDGQLYVVFQGTGSGDGSSSIDGRGTDSEWYTDALGMTESDTAPQIAARNYIDYIGNAYGGNIVVTGHSNGANKAMYCAILSTFVAAAVVFDGQGFSQEFFDKYGDEIQANSFKVTFYGAEGDFVGPLLKPLPINKHYVAHGNLTIDGNPGGNMASNHYIDSLFTEIDGRYVFIEGSPSRLTVEIQKFMSYLFDTYPPEVRETIAPFVGKLLDALMSRTDYDLATLLEDVLNDPSLQGQAAEFFAVLGLYGGLDGLVEGLVEAFVGSQSTGTAAQLGMSVSERILVLIRSRLKALDPRRVIRDRLRALGAAYAQMRVNALTYGAVGDTTAVRDFSDAKRQELLSIVREVESEAWFDPTRWDVWYRAERWFGQLTIKNYQNDMKAYYRKTIDIEGVTANQINSIFDRACTASRTFAQATVRNSFTTHLERLAQALKNLIGHS